MAASGAYRTFGSKLYRGDGASPQAFAAIAELVTIRPGETTVQTKNVTTHDSDVDTESGLACEEFLPVKVSEGEVSAEGHWLGDTAQSALRDDAPGGYAQRGDWMVTWADFGRTLKAFTASGATITSNGHGLVAGQAVQVSSAGTLPAGLLARKTYYVRRLGDNTLQLHATNAGALANSGVITTTSAGSGTHRLRISTTRRFAGLVTARQIGRDDDGVSGLSFKIQVSGPATIG